jgi:hypothetical protein
VFIVAYILFFLLVVFTLYHVRPQLARFCRRS